MCSNMTQLSTFLRSRERQILIGSVSLLFRIPFAMIGCWGIQFCSPDGDNPVPLCELLWSVATSESHFYVHLSSNPQVCQDWGWWGKVPCLAMPVFSLRVLNTATATHRENALFQLSETIVQSVGIENQVWYKILYHGGTVPALCLMKYIDLSRMSS